jgi:hypothetical protein
LTRVTCGAPIAEERHEIPDEANSRGGGRRYLIPISGKAEVEVAYGEKFSVVPGGIYIAEDLTGKGHKFRVVGDEDWVAPFVTFAQ